MMLGLSLSLTTPRASATPPAANLLTNSKWLGAASGTPGTWPTSWSGFVNGGTLTVASDASGGGNSLRVAATANRHFMGQSLSAAANTTYVLSCMADVFTTTPWNSCFGFVTLPTGATLSWRANGGATTTNGNLSPPTGNGILLEAILTIGSTAGTPLSRIGVGYSGNGTGDIRFYDPKLEVGEARTGYLAT